MSTVYIVCPGDTVTGGPELLHQLTNSINKAGGSASIVYYPFNEKFETPDAYSHYHVNPISLDDVENRCDNCVVIPEVVTGLSKNFGGMRTFIWWLSVDNYFKYLPVGIKGLIKVAIGRNRQLPLRQLKQFEHLVQSYYAKGFLKERGIESTMLSDYLNKEHFSHKYDSYLKENIVCYNPKKGYELTSLLINNNPDIVFKPIENMTSEQVAELLAKSKVYIDFGNHPGKDRIPREAAMAGCIVVTGTRGSAGNNYDIPVDRKFKIDENRSDVIDAISTVIIESFDNYELFFDKFQSYRKKIENEESEFNKEVIDFFNNVERPLLQNS